jgi:hypothetical protein
VVQQVGKRPRQVTNEATDTTSTSESKSSDDQPAAMVTVEQHLRQLLDEQVMRIREHGNHLLDRLKDLAADVKKQMSDLTKSSE